ncbi:hypothetical protein GCM10009828_092900 [Actinoplanes couchii]|uniref:Uncharacterized protein n=1 Tax=Actinoplanes couchii TaxID=403638 RepID=A0ABQ3XTP7_9ACTN|nr:hypothetical protein Aco03nite_102040 [Actinoplanes couchii]
MVVSDRGLAAALCRTAGAVTAPAPSDEPTLLEMAADARVRHYFGGTVDRATTIAKATRKVTNPATT